MIGRSVPLRRPGLRRSAGLAGALALAAACQSATPAPPPGPLRLEAAGTGPVAPLVAAAIEREAEARRRVIVYVGATWCEPCNAFHAAAHGGALDAALPGVTLLEFDLDVDRERLAAAGYRSTLVPLFAQPRLDGTASGHQIEGARKGSDYVAELTPRLLSLLAGP